jgi:hypothetical protein
MMKRMNRMIQMGNKTMRSLAMAVKIKKMISRKNPIRFLIRMTTKKKLQII